MSTPLICMKSAADMCTYVHAPTPLRVWSERLCSQAPGTILTRRGEVALMPTDRCLFTTGLLLSCVLRCVCE